MARPKEEWLSIHAVDRVGNPKAVYFRRKAVYTLLDEARGTREIFSFLPQKR
jgi:hypothetical protein